ncbi:MAG: hypothetical protein IJU87_00430 [Lachnospiraceae bacterium]|nr:hypothetical protein [Lachnospiraceae bacterium]
MTDLRYLYHRLTRPKKIKLGSQKKRLSDLERFWYYDTYYVDNALHHDRGKPWKIHKKRINPLEFPQILNTVRLIQKYWLRTLTAIILLFFAIFMNYGSQLVDWIVSYNIQLNAMLDERERAEAERRELLLSLTARGFEEKMGDESSEEMPDELYEKADHFTMDQLELSGDTDAPLTSSAVLSADDIKNILTLTWNANGSLSEEEFRIVKSALLTVGRIPYILGGAQPTRPSNTEKDETGFPIVPDDAIVSFANQISGMDCSHWVDWIYYLAVNNNLGYCNTDSLIYSRGNGALKLIAVDEDGEDYDQGLSNIRAGDIMVYGHDASHRFGHAAILLGYTGRGGDASDMMYVHESSTAGNVSFHVGSVFGNNGSSPVFYFRYRSLDGDEIDYDYDYLRTLQSGADSSSAEDTPEDDEGEDIEEDIEDSEGIVEGGDEIEEAEEDDSEETAPTEGSITDSTESSSSTSSSSSSKSDDDDDDDDDSDSGSYKRYVNDQEAESYEPVNPENTEMNPEDTLIAAP